MDWYYNYRGEAALGRDLKELRLAVDVGRRLDAISPKLSVQARYSYAIVEQVLEIPNNRINAAVEGALQVFRRRWRRRVISSRRARSIRRNVRRSTIACSGTITGTSTAVSRTRCRGSICSSRTWNT